MNESRLRRIVKDSIRRTLNEAYDAYEHGDEMEEIKEELEEAYDNYIAAIKRLQQFRYKVDGEAERGYDMYNTYAGKYGDQAKFRAEQSLREAWKLVYEDDEEDY